VSDPDGSRPPFADSSLRAFVGELAAKRPVPGGGAAAGSALAHAAALGSMVIAYSRGKKTFAPHEALLEEIEADLLEIRREALLLADEDAEAFERLSDLWPLAEDDPRRQKHWAEAVRGAVRPPGRIITLAVKTIEHLTRLVGRSSRLLRSDLAIAARFAALAAEAAAWNVDVNLDALRELPEGQTEAESLATTTTGRIADTRRFADEIDAACRGGGRDPITPA